MQPKILVLGSTGHNRADCFDWLQAFPNIEEYDSIIINLQSLNQTIYTKIQPKIRGMKESITTVFHTDREIFCIMNEMIFPTPIPTPPFIGVPKFKNPNYVSPTNYDWLPLRIRLDTQKNGKSINLFDHRFDIYFEGINRWTFEISTSIGNTNLDNFDCLRHALEPIATNKSKKVIAAKIIHQNLIGNKIGTGAIYLLPPPIKWDHYQAIEIIIDLICGDEEKPVPAWRKEIDVPNMKELGKKIENKLQKIEDIQHEISLLETQMHEWDSYRDLLTVSGKKLERIVQKALSDIGIATKKTEKGFPADLINDKIVIEITGIKSCIGVASEKVIQLARFKENYHMGEKIFLIANTHMNSPPNDREGKIDFSEEVKKFFDSLSVCYFTTKTLFELWKAVATGKKTKKDIIQKILTTSGELSL